MELRVSTNWIVYCLNKKCGENMKFKYRKGMILNISKCPKEYYKIIFEDGSECPLSKIKFETEKEAEEIVEYLNKLATKPRFELRPYETSLSRCFVIWDNLKQKQVPYTPFHIKAGDPRDIYQEYVDFLNELYEETPQYE